MGLGKIVRWSNIEEGKGDVLAWSSEPRNEEWTDYNEELSTLTRLVEKDEPTESDEMQFHKSLQRARTLRRQHIQESTNPKNNDGWIFLIYAGIAFGIGVREFLLAFKS